MAGGFGCRGYRRRVLERRAGARRALPEFQQKIEAASQELQKAAELYRNKKFEEFGKVIDGVQKTIEDLKSGDDKDAAAPLLSNLEVRMEAAHRLLRSSLDTPATTTPKKTAAKTPAPRDAQADGAGEEANAGASQAGGDGGRWRQLHESDCSAIEQQVRPLPHEQS